MVEILEINGIKTNNYTMWYRFPKSIKQKVIYVGNEKVSFSDKITYICPSCKTKNSTILRTFNDRLGTYDDFNYKCKSCVDKNHNLESFSKKQLITKTKNKSRPKDIIKREGTLGFIGKNQKSGSKIRAKMNETKIKNNSFGHKNSNSYFIRMKNWELKSEEELKEIYMKGYNTKIINGTLSNNGKKRIFNNFYDMYKAKVWHFTNKNKLESIKNIEKRGRIGLKNNPFHLDHKYSISEGFKNNIPAHIIGSIYNLEMIPALENCSKQDKCSILLEDLYAHVVNKSGELLETL